MPFTQSYLQVNTYYSQKKILSRQFQISEMKAQNEEN